MAIGNIGCGDDYALETAQMMRAYSLNTLQNSEQVAMQSVIQQNTQQIDISADDYVAELVDIYA